MHAAESTDILNLADPVSGQQWSAPRRRMINEIHAQVRQRLLANFLVDADWLSAFQMPSFLEPQIFRERSVHLSACIIGMRGAAPSWAPEAISPACIGAALRVTCRDKRDNSAAVFVDTRFTNSFLTPMLGFLGLAGFHDGLQITGELGKPGNILTDDWQLTIAPGHPTDDAPHFSDPVFNVMIADGIRSYDANGSCADLTKRGHGSFQRANYLQSRLFWRGNTINGDLRISTGGNYCWKFQNNKTS